LPQLSHQTMIQRIFTAAGGSELPLAGPFGWIIESGDVPTNP
jgi:hypothetical protein